MIRIGVTSDLHGNLIEVLPCDLFIIGGDIVPLHCQRDFLKSEEWFNTKFRTWCNNLPVDRIVLIGGNHDFLLERDYKKDIKLYLNNEKVIVLEDELKEISLDNGNIIKIYGSPFCTSFYDWAFMKPDDELKDIYNNIPEGLDILVTHMPPKLNHLGWIPEYAYDAGSKTLAEVILDKKPKMAFCGHIHSGNHNIKKLGNGISVANVSLLDNSYRIKHKPIYIEYNGRKK
jgi:Icc-related predicted phosphoesterase